MHSLNSSTDVGMRRLPAESRTSRSGANHDRPCRSAVSPAAFILMLMTACSSPDLQPDTEPGIGLPVPPQAPADTAQPDSAVADTITAAPQDTFFEGSEHVWLDAQQRGVTFRAIGQEPGWLVEISGDRRMRVLTDYGADEVIVMPVPVPTVDSTTWTTTYRARADGKDVRIHIRDEPCADTMSGERFSATVTLVLNGIAHQGCGRALDGLL